MHYRILIITLFALLAQTATAQKSKRKSPSETYSYTHNGITAEVNYSRPSKNGRLIFGTKEQRALVPFGKKWRTGANEATEITVSAPVIIDGKTLQAGTYSIYTIPYQDHWIIAFNSRTDYWGKSLVGSPFKEKHDVLRIKTESKRDDKPIELFTIGFSANEQGTLILSMQWDTTFVQVEIESAQH